MQEGLTGKAAPAGASFTLHGAGIGGGIAIGRAHLVSTVLFEVARMEVPAERVEQEVRRLESATEQVRGELVGLRTSVPASAPPEMSAFLDLHLMILQPPLTEAPADLIHQPALERRIGADAADEPGRPVPSRSRTSISAGARATSCRCGKDAEGNAGMEKTRVLREQKFMIVVARDLSPADMALFRATISRASHRPGRTTACDPRAQPQHPGHRRLPGALVRG
jgi:phosphotransferase system enzyme I (PtsI)